MQKAKPTARPLHRVPVSVPARANNNVDPYAQFLATANNTCAYNVLDALTDDSLGVVNGRALFEKMRGTDVQIEPQDLDAILKKQGIWKISIVTISYVSQPVGKAAIVLGPTIDVGPDDGRFIDDYFVVLITTVDSRGWSGAGHYHLMRGGHWRSENYAELLKHLKEVGTLRDVSVNGK